MFHVFRVFNRIMLDDRKKHILTYIVEDYIKSAQPVSSGQLVSKHKLSFSPATVRNDMTLLEKEGYIESPHTSAGRIPTQKGYEHYVTITNVKLQITNKLSKENQELTKAHSLGNDEREKVKNVAKTLAELSQSAVIAGFSQRDIYYTGLSYLFAQPEFKNHDLVYTITEVVDHLESQISNVFDSLSGELNIKIGRENPFAHDCSFIGFTHGDNNQQLFGLLGPMRMPYSENIKRIECVRNLVSSR